MIDECVYIIQEKIILPDGKEQTTLVCAALNEKEAQYKVKYLTENAMIGAPFSGATLEYSYIIIPLGVSTSWLVDLKR